MKNKKTPEADLENKRFLFIQIGLVIALSVVFIAFEWTSLENEPQQLKNIQKIDIEEEIIPITRMQETTPPPPQIKPQLVEEFVIVEDKTELKDELELGSSEADQKTKIEMNEPTFELAEPEEEEEEDIVFNFYLLQEKPEYPGGEEELLKFIASQIKYPTIAEENNISGRVFISFIIDKEGYVTDIKIKRGVHPILDEEALRVVKSIPQWKPGRQRGKPVKVEYVVPISFILN